MPILFMLEYLKNVTKEMIWSDLDYEINIIKLL